MQEKANVCLVDRDEYLARLLELKLRPLGIGLAHLKPDDLRLISFDRLNQKKNSGGNTLPPSTPAIIRRIAAHAQGILS